jgi:hypothetical protein
MGAVKERSPIPSPFQTDAFRGRRRFHGGGEPVVDWRRPDHRAILPHHRQVNGVAGQVARAHRLTLARADELGLPIHRPQPFRHDEPHPAVSRRALDDPDEIGVDAGHAPPAAIGQRHFRLPLVRSYARMPARPSMLVSMVYCSSTGIDGSGGATAPVAAATTASTQVSSGCPSQL